MQDVSVAPLRFSEGEAAAPTGVKRAQLEAEVMRFADRYAGWMATEMFRLLEQETSRDLRWFAAAWMTRSRTAVADIAVGPNAVENYLNMLVLTALTRYSVESYGRPNFLARNWARDLLRHRRLLRKMPGAAPKKS